MKRLATSILLALASAACAPSSKEPLHIGLSPWPGWEFLYLAQHQGYFEDEHVAVHIEQFSSLSDTVRAFERRQIDGMTVTLVELIRAQSVGDRNPAVVYVTDYSAGADVVLAKEGIVDVAGLRGKRVGVEPGSLNVYILARALQLSQLALTDVEMVALDPLSMKSALAAGEVDAVVCYPPVSTAIVSSGAHAVFSSASLPGEVVDVVAFDAESIRSRADDIAAVLRAFDRARRWADAHHEEADAIMAGRIGMQPAEFRDALDHGVKLVAMEEQLPYLRPEGHIATTVRAIVDVLRSTGQTVELDPAHCCASEVPWHSAARARP